MKFTRTKFQVLGIRPVTQYQNLYNYFCITWTSSEKLVLMLNLYFWMNILYFSLFIKIAIHPQMDSQWLTGYNVAARDIQCKRISNNTQAELCKIQKHFLTSSLFTLASDKIWWHFKLWWRVECILKGKINNRIKFISLVLEKKNTVFSSILISKKKSY